MAKGRRRGHTWELNTTASRLNVGMIAYHSVSLTFPMTLGSTLSLFFCTLSILLLDCLREGSGAQQLSPRASCLCSHPSNTRALPFYQDDLQKCRGREDTLALHVVAQSPAWTCKILLLLSPLALTPLPRCKTSPCSPHIPKTYLPSMSPFALDANVLLPFLPTCISHPLQ